MELGVGVVCDRAAAVGTGAVAVGVGVVCVGSAAIGYVVNGAIRL